MKISAPRAKNTLVASIAANGWFITARSRRNRPNDQPRALASASSRWPSVSRALSTPPSTRSPAALAVAELTYPERPASIRAIVDSTFARGRMINRTSR